MKDPKGHNDSDWQCIQAIQRGTREAADQLMLKYQSRVMHIALRYVHEPEAAKDITQETFIKVFRGISDFRGDSQFYTWLHRIALNTSKNYLIQKGHCGIETDMEAPNFDALCMETYLSDAETPEKILQKDEVEQEVFQAIEALSTDLRMSIVLRELNGLSYGEIAEIMDCPVGTVRSRISRARESIKGRLH
jgi:RNA polymerase sigma-70 factor (ECF subfamily)